MRRMPLHPARVPQLPTGVVVGVRISGVWHEGIVEQSDGTTWVWNKSKRTGRVERESWDAFGRNLPAVEIGYLGELPPDVVIARARARTGEQWTPVQNCQRFTRQCHGVRRGAPDVDAVGLACLFAMLGPL